VRAARRQRAREVAVAFCRKIAFTVIDPVVSAKVWFRQTFAEILALE